MIVTRETEGQPFCAKWLESIFLLSWSTNADNGHSPSLLSLSLSLFVLPCRKKKTTERKAIAWLVRLDKGFRISPTELAIDVHGLARVFQILASYTYLRVVHIYILKFYWALFHYVLLVISEADRIFRGTSMYVCFAEKSILRAGNVHRIVY